MKRRQMNKIEFSIKIEINSQGIRWKFGLSYRTFKIITFQQSSYHSEIVKTILKLLHIHNAYQPSTAHVHCANTYRTFGRESLMALSSSYQTQ